MMENNSLSIETTATTRRRVSIGQAALIIVMATLAARVFGLFRGSLFTAVFGATATSDAFNRAFVVPNAIYTIVTGGALASAFRPVFNAYLLEKGDESDAWCVASSALNNDSVCLSHPAGFVCDAGCYSRDSLDIRPRAGNC